MSLRRCGRLMTLWFVTVAMPSVAQVEAEPTAAAPATISRGVVDESGIVTHRVDSAYQRTTTLIRVLSPDESDSDRLYPVVYVLPVEAGRGGRFGDGLNEVRKLGLHNKYQVLFVAPTFSDLPWYANHPGQRTLQQETYFVEDIVPFIERTYPAERKATGRLLLGFSKSGWGAWSLLLRNPGRFGRAVAWDAPLMMDSPGKYGSGPIFGTAECFQEYEITRLLRVHRVNPDSAPRFILAGYANFLRDHQQIHELLCTLKIPHVYRDGPEQAHHWASGWVGPCVELLLADTESHDE